MEIKEIRLGNIILPNNVLMAPLAGYTCLPFRCLCYELGAGLCFTEMVNVNSLRYNDIATKKLLLSTKEEKYKAVQLIGSDPNAFEQMVKSEYISNFDIIDINMGCPVPNIVKSGQGSALIGDLKRASEIIKRCRKSDKIITVKTRIGLKEDKLIAAEFAKMCEYSGVNMITIHGRSRNMMYKGNPYFNQIEQAVSVVNIPVIANGGICSKKDADTMMELTGAAGVMIARYALENPFIFSELTNKKVVKSFRTIIDEQIELTLRYYDEVFTLDYIKKFISFCMRTQKGSNKLKHLLYRCGNLNEIKDIVNCIFRKGECTNI